MRFSTETITFLLACLVLLTVETEQGLAQEMATNQTAQRFVIDVPPAVLHDLDERLALTRWPDQPSGTAWAYGADTAYLRELVAYWRSDFDWSRQQARLNEFEHYRALVGGM